jgi:hypothetical protein
MVIVTVPVPSSWLTRGFSSILAQAARTVIAAARLRTVIVPYIVLIIVLL